MLVLLCVYRLDDEAHELERRRQRLREQFKRGSGSSSLEGSGHFLSGKKASIDSAGSPVQHQSSPLLPHRLADVEEKDKNSPDLSARQERGGEDWW